GSRGWSSWRSSRRATGRTAATTRTLGWGGRMAAEPQRLERYSRTERAVHWVHAAAFTILLASGLALYLPSLAEAVGRRPLLKAIHLWTAVAWAIALVLVLVLASRRSLRRTAREVDRFDADDRAWFRDPSRPSGRLNA